MALGFRGWHERGYLPHFDKPNLTQFVTFRLADAFPRELYSEWKDLLRIEDDERRISELHAYLDRGRGQCHLRRPELAGLVESCLQFFHNDRYLLRAWTVMPNHVHVLFRTLDVPMTRVVESWKSYSAKEANSILGRRGRYWDPDYWDTYMRDATHEQGTIRYIESNAVNAGIIKPGQVWPWSSARFRAADDTLQLPQ